MNCFANWSLIRKVLPKPAEQNRLFRQALRTILGISSQPPRTREPGLNIFQQRLSPDGITTSVPTGNLLLMKDPFTFAMSKLSDKNGLP